MVALNSQGEVCDLLDVNQFIPAHSAYECVAYSGALCKYMGQPGAGPTGSAMQASNLAQYWYGREEGSNNTANTNGMSLDAEYDMLNNIALSFHILDPSVDEARTAVQAGRPVLLCGAETGMFDMGLGDRVPYTWTPTGNHCIVVSGVHADGNLLVHDCANVDANGVRPGPRLYDASKMHLVSATAIVPPWQITPQEEIVSIDLTNPEVAHYFQAVPGNAQQWKCVQTGKIIQYGLLSAYQQWGNSALCGLSYLGLPQSGEISLKTSNGAVKQYFERGVLVWDPVPHQVDNPPGVGNVYAAHLYSGVGVDPMIAVFEAKIVALQNAQPSVNPTITADMQTIKAANAQITAVTSKY